MSDVFISYASADREKARDIAETLARRGWTVWWDRTIPPGREFDDVIEEALDAAKCVVVLWSKTSTASSWVKTEAADAMRRKILVPALIEGVKLPLEFRRLQAADLSGHGEESNAEFDKLFQAIERLAPRGRRAEGSATAPVASPVETRSRPADVRRTDADAEARPVSRPRDGQPEKSRSRFPLFAIIAGIALVIAAAAGYSVYSERAKDRAASEQGAKERAAREQSARDRAAREQAAREQAAKDQAAKDQEAADLAARSAANDGKRAGRDLDACVQGYVWRRAFPGDHVCVEPTVRALTIDENRLAARRRQRSGGAPGPDTCRQRFVWREASPDDHVCVSPVRRAQVQQENRQAAERVARE